MAAEETQASLSLGPVLIGLVPVIIGGLIAVGGGLVGSFISHKLAKASSAEALEREKLEALVNAAYRAMHWLDRYKSAHLFDGEPLMEESPVSEIEMISKLYFPELRRETLRVVKATIAFQNWVLKWKETIVIEKKNAKPEYEIGIQSNLRRVV